MVSSLVQLIGRCATNARYNRASLAVAGGRGGGVGVGVGGGRAGGIYDACMNQGVYTYNKVRYFRGFCVLVVGGAYVKNTTA
jgi:hypothetical protein